VCHHCCDAYRGFSRREVIMGLAASSVAGGLLLRGGQAAAETAASQPAAARGKPQVRAAFLRPREAYWLGWPGTAWDKNVCKGFMDKSKELIGKFAAGLDVDVQWSDEPLYDQAAVERFIVQAKADQPQGLILLPLHFRNWPDVYKIAEAGVPTIIFAPLGVCFTGHIQKVAKQPGVYLASCADFELAPVRFGLKMIRANHDIRRTRIAVLARKESGDQVLEPFGLSVRHVPRNRFPAIFKTIETTPEVRAMAEEYRKLADKVVEPTEEDLINAAKNYFVAKKIMEENDCQGITMDCLGLVTERLVPTPPCMAWSMFLDHGVSATCEADLHAVMSQELCLKLLGKPGFVQDPVPNTVDNTFIGAHCVCGTRIFGYDQPRAKFILRSHAESDIGVSLQVIWPPGTEVTVMELTEPGKMIVGQGKVLRNFDTPPAGGCRTSVELQLDAPSDVRDTKGFHQLFIAGKHMRDFQAYAQMYGISVEHI